MSNDLEQVAFTPHFQIPMMETSTGPPIYPVYHVPTSTHLSNITTSVHQTNELPNFVLTHSDAITAGIVTVTSILTIGCILGNFLVILAVLQVHKLRTPSNCLILSLAVSDLLVGCIVMPLAILPQIFTKWPLGRMACILWTTSDVTLCTASILTLMMISIDRYLIISKPFKYPRYRTAKLMCLYISIAWIVSLLISLTPVFVGNDWLPDTKNGGCEVSPELAYQMYATFGSFYLPLTVMFTLYGRIFYIAWRISKIEKKNHPHAAEQPRTPSYHSSSNSSPMPEPKNDHLHGKKKKRDVLPDKLPVNTLTVRSSLSVPIDHNVMDDTILEDESSTDVPTESDWLRKNEHNHHHNHHHHNNHSNNNNHLTPEHNNTNHHGHRHGSWPLKKLSIVTITSVRKFLTRRKHKGNTHAIKTLGVIMGLFTACWLPFFVLAAATPLCGVNGCGIPPWVYQAALWLGYVNSCFNPIIYARFNREFRTPFKEIICFRCHKINESVRHTDYLYQYGEPDQDHTHHTHHQV